MNIHAITTGTVRITTAMERGRPPLRLLRTLLDRNLTAALPIHAWLLEHEDGPILVDTGELASTRDMPMARFHVESEDEIDRRLAVAGVAPDELAAVVLTHLHGDHVNGLARLPGAEVRASREALSRGGARRLRRRFGAQAREIVLGREPFGGFERSAPLTRDGRVLAVGLPGHARGHIGVVIIEPDHHVLLGGDSAYSQRQMLDGASDGVSLSPRRARESMRAIAAHAAEHPLVYLPTHDPASAARLRERLPVPPR